jgi:hypothetical protein
MPERRDPQDSESSLYDYDDTRPARSHDDFVVTHNGSPVPACSATMYAAYQSGQSEAFGHPWLTWADML